MYPKLTCKEAKSLPLKILIDYTIFNYVSKISFVFLSKIHLIYHILIKAIEETLLSFYPSSSPSSCSTGTPKV